MNLSSLREKMSEAKMLALVLLVGLFSLTFLLIYTNRANAATSAPIAPTSTSNVAHQAITYTWTAAAGFSGTLWVVASSTNRVTLITNTLTPTSTVSYTFTGLATNTGYYFGVAGSDATGATSSYATSSFVYTLADNPTTTVGAPTVSTIPITIGTATNPSTTQYAIAIPTLDKFLDATGAPTSTAVWQTSSTWGSSFAATGLSGNTAYQFYTLARNGNNVQTTSTVYTAATTTLSNVPTSASVASGPNSLTFTWGGDSTTTYAEDVTAGTNTGWTTATSFQVGGINCNTSHSFRVKGRNAFGTETAFTSQVSGTTGACGAGIIVGAPIAVPDIPSLPANPSSVTLPSSASPVAVFVHTLRVGARGEEVRMLQAKLRELGYFNYPTDTGYFGSVTRAAVVAFQKAHGLAPFPGHVGPATRAALNNL